jgi:hypothetical protein
LGHVDDAFGDDFARCPRISWTCKATAGFFNPVPGVVERCCQQLNCFRIETVSGWTYFRNSLIAPPFFPPRVTETQGTQCRFLAYDHKSELKFGSEVWGNSTITADKKRQYRYLVGCFAGFGQTCARRG